MKLDVNRLKESLAFLGMAISKNNTSRISTKMIELVTEPDNFLYGYTYDGENNAIRFKICAATDSLKVVVLYSTLYDIIKSCEGIIELTVKNNALMVKSDNMKCKIPTYDINISKEFEDNIITTGTNIDFSNIKEILPICKVILDTKFVVECYRHVYFGDNVMVTDTNNVAIINKNIFNEDMLLSIESVDLLSHLTNSIFQTKLVEDSNKNKQKFLLVSNDEVNIKIFLKIRSDYQYNDLMDLFNINIKNNAVIDRSVMSKAVSVGSLFNQSPILIFDKDGASLQIKQSDFVYKLDSNSYDTHQYNTSSDIFKKIFTISDDKINLDFDENEFIKCSTNDIQAILSIEHVKEE